MYQHCSSVLMFTFLSSCRHAVHSMFCCRPNVVPCTTHETAVSKVFGSNSLPRSLCQPTQVLSAGISSLCPLFKTVCSNVSPFIILLKILCSYNSRTRFGSFNKGSSHPCMHHSWLEVTQANCHIRPSLSVIVY